MSFKSVVEASVKSPKDKHPRRGRGFSRKELQEANLRIDEARRLGLIVDLRRKTFYDDNVEVLKAYAEDMRKLLSLEAKKPTPTETKESAVIELSSLKSVTESEARLLVKAGISTIEDLAYCEIDKVTKKTGLDDNTITKMIKEALKKI
jgi:transcription termination factor NusA